MTLPIDFWSLLIEKPGKLCHT